jgi:hypothetical protein
MFHKKEQLKVAERYNQRKGTRKKTGCKTEEKRITPEINAELPDLQVRKYFMFWSMLYYTKVRSLVLDEIQHSVVYCSCAQLLVYPALHKLHSCDKTQFIFHPHYEDPCQRCRINQHILVSLDLTPHPRNISLLVLLLFFVT